MKRSASRCFLSHEPHRTTHLRPLSMFRSEPHACPRVCSHGAALLQSTASEPIRTTVGAKMLAGTTPHRGSTGSSRKICCQRWRRMPGLCDTDTSRIGSAEDIHSCTAIALCTEAEQKGASFLASVPERC